MRSDPDEVLVAVQCHRAGLLCVSSRQARAPAGRTRGARARRLVELGGRSALAEQPHPELVGRVQGLLHAGDAVPDDRDLLALQQRQVRQLPVASVCWIVANAAVRAAPDWVSSLVSSGSTPSCVARPVRRALVAVVGEDEVVLGQERAEVVVGVDVVGEPAELVDRVGVLDPLLGVGRPRSADCRLTLNRPVASSWRLISPYSSAEVGP